MTAYRLQPAAAADLEEIVDYVSGDDPRAALRVHNRILGAFRALGAFPLIGHARPDLTAERVRFLSVGNYVIVYRHDVRPVQILRVLHAARDLSALLDDKRPRPDDQVSDRVVTSPDVTRSRTHVSLPGRVRRGRAGKAPTMAGVRAHLANSPRYAVRDTARHYTARRWNPSAGATAIRAMCG